jgi:alkylation response protein AidB-like acyl-CoA dehydrogenase
MPTIDDFTRPKEWIPEMIEAMAMSIREWVDDRYMPIRRKIDEDWTEHKLVKPLLKEVMVDFGLNRSVWPIDVGGLDISSLGATGVSTIRIFEELGRADCGFAVACACSLWPVIPIAQLPHRNMELCNEFGPKYCGDKLYMGCYAMTEPEGGADIENIGRIHGRTIRTTANRKGSEWIINGHKQWPTNSGKVANLFCVLCITDEGKDEEGLRLIYVPADTRGVSVGPAYHKAGMAADMNTDIYLDDVHVPLRYNAQPVEWTMKCFNEIITIGNLGTAAFSLGVLKNTYEIIKKYASERVVAGKPLKEHSMNAVILAELAIAIEAASTYSYTMAHMVDTPDVYGPTWSQKIVAKTRACSMFVSDMAVNHTGRIMELMGSYGYTREGDIEKHWRDSKMLQLWMGGKQLDLMEVARYFYEGETL